MSSPAIRVTDHAAARARERYPDLATYSEQHLLRTICHEVGLALREGRWAKTAPREVLTPQYTRRHKGKAGARYAWTAARHRVYVIVRNKHEVVVLSVLATWQP